MEIIFTAINTETWHRREVFWYFSQMAPTGYSLTVDVDITLLHSTLKKEGIPFYPAYLWLVTKAVNQQPEFKTAVKDGQLGYYSHLTPMYAVFHDDDKTFSLMWTEYSDDFKVFYQSYKADNEKYKNNPNSIAKCYFLLKKFKFCGIIVHKFRYNLYRSLIVVEVRNYKYKGGGLYGR